MSFTKVTSAGIGSTELVTLDSLEVINNASIGGVLTYEDVTNVDSVGIITARAGVLVGSGITLSKDGDVFFTGIATGNGSGLTALNASNLASGTVPTARLGSGTASSSTFLRGDSTFQTVNTDLVSDTSPQLGGNLDVNTKNIVFGDSASSSDDRLQFGASQDLNIFHDGTDSHIRNNEGKLIITNDDSGGDDLHLRGKVSEESIICRRDGAVELYYDNAKTFETTNEGATFDTNSSSCVVRLTSNTDAVTVLQGFNSDFTVKAPSGGAIILQANASEDAIKCVSNGQVELYHNSNLQCQTIDGGLNFQDGKKAEFGNSGDLKLYHSSNNSYLTNDTGYLFLQSDSISLAAKSAGENFLVANKDGAVQLYYDSVKTFETSSNGATILAGEGGSAYLYMSSDEGDDNGDKWQIKIDNGDQALQINNYSTGSWVNYETISSNGYVTKPYTPSFSAKGTTDAISAASPLPFDSVSGINYNNGGHYNTSTYKFTCPVTGYYYVTCHVVPTNYDVAANVELYVADNSGNRHFLDRKVKTSSYASNNFSVGGSRIIYKASGSTLWVEFNGIAGSPTLEGSSHFGITLIA